VKHKILNTLIEPSWFAEKITATLGMIDRGESLMDSPLARFMRKHPGGAGIHASCSGVTDYEEAIQGRIEEVIRLYHEIKENGYNGSEVLCFFDEDGRLQVYDGHHRLTILRYLGIDCEVNVETEWRGLNGDSHSPKESHLFPLRERLTVAGGRVRVYQPIDDERVAGIPVERPASATRLEWIAEHLVPGPVLDIGCSEGFISRGLLSRGRLVTSIESDPNLAAVSRYLTTCANLRGDIHCGRWQDFVGLRERFGNILFLSVLHNEVNAMGEAKAFGELARMRDKASRYFVEVPDVAKQADWAHVFTIEKLVPRLEAILNAKMAEVYVGPEEARTGCRPIIVLDALPVPVEAPALPAAVVPVKVENVLNEGIALTFLSSDHVILPRLQRDKVWEENTTQFVRQHLKAGQMFVDVGANVGYFSVLASRIVGDHGQVLAFEAAADNFALLQENLVANGCSNVAAQQIAVSNTDGQSLLLRKPDAGHHTLIGDDKHIGSEVVPCAMLDSLLKLVQPDMVKIDVEGAERMVLEGADTLLKTREPLTLIVEDWADGQGIADWLVKDYGFTLALRSRADGTACLTKNDTRRRLAVQRERLSCHLVGNIDIPTVNGGVDAFATKAVAFASVLKALGHHVTFYGVEGSIVPDADEMVTVLGAMDLLAAYGPGWAGGHLMQRFDALHMKFIDRTTAEINRRRVNLDFLMLTGGTNHEPIAKKTGLPMTMEIGIGYVGSFAPFRVFESDVWRHWTYGRQNEDNGRFTDCVIPPFFNPKDFAYSQKKEDYYLYLGRVTEKKGVRVAIETVQAIGGRLIIAGPRMDQTTPVDGPCIEYVGVADQKMKRQLLSKARAVFVPTTYLEPFGYVVAEAALSGTPVITTDFGAFRENVLHGVTGFRCRTLDQFIWAAENVHRLSPQQCLTWGTSQFSIEAAVPRYAQYLAQLLDLWGKGWYAKSHNRNPGALIG